MTQCLGDNYGKEKENRGTSRVRTDKHRSKGQSEEGGKSSQQEKQMTALIINRVWNEPLGRSLSTSRVVQLMQSLIRRRKKTGGRERQKGSLWRVWNKVLRGLFPILPP